MTKRLLPLPGLGSLDRPISNSRYSHPALSCGNGEPSPSYAPRLLPNSFLLMPLLSSFFAFINASFASGKSAEEGLIGIRDLWIRLLIGLSLTTQAQKFSELD